EFYNKKEGLVQEVRECQGGILGPCACSFQWGRLLAENATVTFTRNSLALE
ncbi:unnamed protein product, partial [Effrenium voratum]